MSLPILSLGSQDAWAFLLSCLGKRKQADAQTPASQGCEGLQIQRSDHGKPWLPRAAESDKSFIPHSTFSVWNLNVRNFAQSYTTVLLLFRVQKPYFGPELGCSAVKRERAKGLILLCPYLRQGHECSRTIEREDGEVYCRVTMFILR